MIVVNFSHPLTAEQQAQVETMTGQEIRRIIDVPTHFDDAEPFTVQVAALIERAGLTPEEWQTLPLLVNLPSYSPIAATLLAYVHGVSGHFPSVLRLRRSEEDGVPRFEVTEVVSLDHLRATARRRREAGGR